MYVAWGLIVFAILVIVLVGVLIAKMVAVSNVSKAQRANIARIRVSVELSEDVGRFGTWHLNVKTREVEWSDYVFDMHRRPKLMGAPTLEQAIGYYHDDDRGAVDQAVRRAMEQGEDFEFRARIVTESGQELAVLARGTCQFDRDGTVIGVLDASSISVCPMSDNC